jgi:hypothetical protein
MLTNAMLYKKLLLLFLFAIFQTYVCAQESALLIEQKQIIAELSGHIKLKDGSVIASRSSKQEREQARVYLLDLFKSLGLKPERQTYTLPNVNPLVDLLINPFKGANVYKVLPATQASDMYVIVGAHFDSERNCPGAIDNATGTAISFGVIKRLANLKNRKVNAILVYFDQEEEELIGSQAFARKLQKEAYKVLSVHTLDTMGWDRDDDHAIELELPTEDLMQLYQTKGAQLGIPIHITKVNSTDHHSFRELGFNATGLTDEYVNGDYTPYKDTAKDTYETVNFEYVASTTELLYQVLKHIIQE